jgi:single-strand DNA-binding protein
VNRVWRDDSGTEHEEVLYVDIDVWDKQAEAVSKYLNKGSPCFVEGRLKLDSWDDKESGQKKSKIKVVAERVQFLGAPRKAEFSGGEAAAERPQARRAQPAPAASAAPANEEPSAEGDDIPF